MEILEYYRAAKPYYQGEPAGFAGNEIRQVRLKVLYLQIVLVDVEPKQILRNILWRHKNEN